VTLETNLAEFNATLERYAAVYDPNGWFRPDVVLKQGAKLGFAWAKRLEAYMPGKGTIRAERLAALNAGGGVKVREQVLRRVAAKVGLRSRLSDRKSVFGKKGVQSRLVKGKRLNFRALAVRAELNLRESGVGYTRHASRVRALSQFAGSREARIRSGQWQHRGRYNTLLATAGLDFDGLTLRYGSSKSIAGQALSTPDALAALAGALGDVREDMEVYLTRKANEKAKEAGFK